MKKNDNAAKAAKTSNVPTRKETTEAAKALFEKMQILGGCLKSIRDFRTSVPELKKWAQEVGGVQNITIEEIIGAWGKYDASSSPDNPICVEPVSLYKLVYHDNYEAAREAGKQWHPIQDMTPEEAEFHFEKTTTKSGMVRYTKEVDCTVYQQKKKWTIAQVMQCIRDARDTSKKLTQTFYKLETPYIKIEKKEKISPIPDHQYRALNSTRALEEELRLANRMDEE